MASTPSDWEGSLTWAINIRPLAAGEPLTAPRKPWYLVNPSNTAIIGCTIARSWAWAKHGHVVLIGWFPNTIEGYSGGTFIIGPLSITIAWQN